MLDTTNECLAAINSYKIVTANWYPIIIYLLSQRLDSESIKHWGEKIQGQKTIPKLQVFLDFLEIRINILETSMNTREFSPNIRSHSNPPYNKYTGKPKQVLLNTTKIPKCTICSQEHRTHTCPLLLEKTVETRKQLFVD